MSKQQSVVHGQQASTLLAVLKDLPTDIDTAITEINNIRSSIKCQA